MPGPVSLNEISTEPASTRVATVKRPLPPFGFSPMA